VQIGMALRTAGGRLRKHQADVTTLARHTLVQPLQRKASLPVVVEFQLPADRFPRSCCVAVLAGNFQSAVWIRRPGR
jgi:hypothetical protein